MIDIGEKWLTMILFQATMGERLMVLMLTGKIRQLCNDIVHGKPVPSIEISLVSYVAMCRSYCRLSNVIVGILLRT
jgi:hypothetical protein